MGGLIPVNPPVIDSLNDPLLHDHGVKLDLVRLDKIHPEVNGNKWFKLKLNLQAALDGGHDTILSFGGAYSNHLRALAAACAAVDLKGIGVIRGELPEPLNPVLSFAQSQGMAFHPVSRQQYRMKHSDKFIGELRDSYGDFYLVPEGGSNELGVRGCEEIVDFVIPRLIEPEAKDAPYLAVACGTGSTLAGLIRAVSNNELVIQLVGVSVLKGADFLQQEVESWLGGRTAKSNEISWGLELGYHFGGYARSTTELEQFIERFEGLHQAPLEPVYTGKMLFGIYDMVTRGRIRPGSHIIALHTGGIY